MFRQSEMEFGNEYIKAKFDKNHESYFCVNKIRIKHFFLSIYWLPPYKENKISLYKHEWIIVPNKTYLFRFWNVA